MAMPSGMRPTDESSVTLEEKAMPGWLQWLHPLRRSIVGVRYVSVDYGRTVLLELPDGSVIAYDDLIGS